VQEHLSSAIPDLPATPSWRYFCPILHRGMHPISRQRKQSIPQLPRFLLPGLPEIVPDEMLEVGVGCHTDLRLEGTGKFREAARKVALSSGARSFTGIRLGIGSFSHFGDGLAAVDRTHRRRNGFDAGRRVERTIAAFQRTAHRKEPMPVRRPAIPRMSLKGRGRSSVRCS